MESDIREKITAKRARRAQRKTSISTEQENLAYEDDESQSTPRNKQILTKKHRDKSRELSEQIVEENPVQVENEIDNIRDRIREKLRKNLLTKLEKVKSEETQSDKDDTLKPDTKLDLTSSSMEQASLRQSAAEAFKQKMHKLQQQNAEKNYRLVTSSRKDRPGSALDERISEESKKMEREKERKAKNKFRKLGLAVIDEIRLPNSEEQFDFFAKKTWEKAEEEEKPEEPKEAEIKTEDDEKDDKDSAPLIINLEDDWREMSYLKALYVPEDQVREAEAKKLFMPLSSKVPFEQKTSAEGIQPRFLDEEGIYVGRKPYVTRKNKNLMENRLLKFPDKIGLKWFEVDGEIVALADPIKYVSTRPSFNDTLPEALWSSYRKAVYLENFARNVVAEKGGLNSINVARYRLDLDINQVQFSFHHLFSAEHVIAYRLKNMYEHFKLSEEKNLVEILAQKLNALKSAMTNFKGEIASQGVDLDENKPSQADLARLNSYKNEIKLTRQLRDNEMFLKKNLTEKILSTWKELKDLRIKQNYRNTEYKLIIKKQNVNKSKEEKKLERELKEEFDEIIAEKKELYDQEMLEYGQKYRMWKYQKNRKQGALERQERRQNNKETVNHDLTALVQEKEQEEKDIEILNEPDQPEPAKPEEINEEQIFESLQKHYNECRKAPGDPILYFELVEEPAMITSTHECLEIEKKRRNKLIRTKVFVKIYLNHKLVYKTSESQLQNDFTVKWAQIFNVFMISRPDSVILQLFEKVDSTERMIAEVLIPTPDDNRTCQNYALEDFDFSSSEEFYMYLKTSNQSELFFTSGKLKAGLGWGVDENDTVLAPPKPQNASSAVLYAEDMKNFDAIAALGVSHMQDLEKLAKWVTKSNLDPNDPKNADLMDLIRALTQSNGTNENLSGYKLPDYFRLDQAIEEFNFVKDEDMDNDKRFKMIMLRDQMEPEFRGYQMIPVYDRLIKRAQFDEYERRKQRELTGDEEVEKPNEKMSSTKLNQRMNQIDIVRNRGRKYVEKIRQKIIKEFRFAQSQKTLADMIFEEQMPNINAISNLFWTLYVEPKRPLYPRRRERKKIKGQNISPDDVSILVTVVNAYSLPVRRENIRNDPMKTIKDPISGRTIRVHENIAGDSLVQPFVEVTFQEEVRRTATANGPNASWNTELKFQFQPPNNDLRPESLQTCKDSLYINVFDEVEVDVLEDERDRDYTVHLKKHRYWLGGLKIPFSNVYFKSKIEGTFKIETPPVLLGYTRDPKQSYLQSMSTFDPNVNLDEPLKESSYISLFITIDPQLVVPDAFREGYDSIESIELLDKVVTWSTGLKKKYPNRDLKPVVMNTDGKSVLITRYIRSIKPPEELIENGETSLETALKVAKFVSMIPFVSDSLIFPGICDIWSTSDQFLEILSGDEEEHSVLLVNFFLGLGKKAWLLIGSSITSGLSCYPLTLEKDGYTLWYQGEPYKVNEPHNPVNVVSALVDSTDIWFNVQPFEEPYRIKFENLSNSKQWRPFLGKSSIQTFETVQPEKLVFAITDEKNVSDLESRIEIEIKTKLKEWRQSRYSTRFANFVSIPLKRLLKEMEKNVNLKIQDSEPDALKQTIESYRLSGFPINIPYTNMESVIEAVYATQIHAIATENVQFAVSVYVHPYPNTILSVWIYLALLFPKN